MDLTENNTHNHTKNTQRKHDYAVGRLKKKNKKREEIYAVAQFGYILREILSIDFYSWKAIEKSVDPRTGPILCQRRKQ